MSEGTPQPNNPEIQPDYNKAIAELTPVVQRMSKSNGEEFSLEAATKVASASIHGIMGIHELLVDGANKIVAKTGRDYSDVFSDLLGEWYTKVVEEYQSENSDNEL